MLTSRRDYLLRIIDEVGRLLARLVFQRRSGREQEALQSVVQACERLFNLEASQLFQLTPDQHFLMLTRDVPPTDARNGILLYAALNAEAGRAYLALKNPAMARASFMNALRFTLRALAEFPPENLPTYSPQVSELLELLKNQPLDADVQEMLRTAAAPERQMDKQTGG